MGVGKTGRLAGDENVAHQGDFETAGDRKAVDGADQGFTCPGDDIVKVIKEELRLGSKCYIFCIDFYFNS